MRDELKVGSAYLESQPAPLLVLVLPLITAQKTMQLEGYTR